MTGTAGAATAPLPADPACDASLPLVWIDDGRTSRGRWTRPSVKRRGSGRRPASPSTGAIDTERAIRADELLVMVREQLAGRPRTDLRVKRRHTLGRVILVTPDRPSRLIELSLPAVTTSVQAQSLFGRPVRDLPPAARDVAVGRALGRVLADEIGHWLFGRGHTPDGLMRASIKRRDLVDPIAPALPAAWPSSARLRLQGRRRARAVVSRPSTRHQQRNRLMSLNSFARSLRGRLLTSHVRRRRVAALALAATALASTSGLQASDERRDRTPSTIVFTIDVAEDFSQFVPTKVKPEDTQPERGAFFVTEGRILPAGTIPRGHAGGAEQLRSERRRARSARGSAAGRTSSRARCSR